MKTIKFRAWDLESKKFTRTSCTVRIDFDNTPAYLVFQQFTGLLDKNCVEIYEGDLLKVMINQENSEAIMEVCYQGCAYDACYVDTKVCTFLSSVTHEAEVIGNIYENEELLK